MRKYCSIPAPPTSCNSRILVKKMERKRFRGSVLAVARRCDGEGGAEDRQHAEVLLHSGAADLMQLAHPREEDGAEAIPQVRVGRGQEMLLRSLHVYPELLEIINLMTPFRL